MSKAGLLYYALILWIYRESICLIPSCAQSLFHAHLQQRYFERDTCFLFSKYKGFCQIVLWTLTMVQRPIKTQTIYWYGCAPGRGQVLLSILHPGLASRIWNLQCLLYWCNLVYVIAYTAVCTFLAFPCYLMIHQKKKNLSYLH